eukprot:tig00001254_g7816.t1
MIRRIGRIARVAASSAISAASVQSRQLIRAASAASSLSSPFARRTYRAGSEGSASGSAGAAAGASSEWILFAVAGAGFVAVVMTAGDPHKAYAEKLAEKQAGGKAVQAGSSDGSPAPIYRIVLTGGPCAGKTTALAMVHDKLADAGFKVFMVPEAATLMLMGGALENSHFSMEHIVRFQSNIVKVQMAIEDAFTDLARGCGAPAVVVCDRGVMDGAAYMPPEMWDALLDENGWNVVSLRDRRYEGVIHMVTAAIGASNHYSKETNAARMEGADEARKLDLRLREAWTGHPRLRIVDNSTSFQEKCTRVVSAVLAMCGLPMPTALTRKFLVLPLDSSQVAALTGGGRVEEFDIEDRYLKTTDGSESKLRRRGQSGSWVYMHTVLTRAPDGQLVESKRQISGREYMNLLSMADPTRPVVKRRRACFLYQDHPFLLDHFVDPPAVLGVLRVDCETGEKDVRMPARIQVVKEVTGKDTYAAEQVGTLLK